MAGTVQGTAGKDGAVRTEGLEEKGLTIGNAPVTLMLSKDEFITLFKACEDRQRKLDHIQRTSDDEDEIADAGNDLIEIGMTLRRLKDVADEAWGESGWTTSDEYL